MTRFSLAGEAVPTPRLDARRPPCGEVRQRGGVAAAAASADGLPSALDLPRAALPRLAMSADEVAGVLGISRAKVYELIQTGDIPSVRLGRRVVVPWRLLDELLHGTPDATQPVQVPTCTCSHFTAAADQAVGTA